MPKDFKVFFWEENPEMFTTAGWFARFCILQIYNMYIYWNSIWIWLFRMIVPIHHSIQSCHMPLEAIIFLKQLPWGNSLKMLESRITQFRWCGWADSSNKLTPQQLKQCLTLWESHQLWASSIRLPELSGIVGLTYIISSHSLFVRFEMLDMMFVNGLGIIIINIYI